jgi:hypothetical protein
MRRFRIVSIGVFGSALVALLAIPATGQKATNLGTGLTALADPVPEARSRAFYQLIGPFYGPGGADTEAADARLLKAYPAGAESIKQALIDALERESDYARSLEDGGQQLTEDLLNYCYDLRRAVGSIRDARAIKALLAIQSTSMGVEPEFIGDLCPNALDEIIAAFRQPSRRWRGVESHNQAGPIWDLGECLKKVDLDSASSGKARAVLLAALGHADSSVRQAALEGLFPLRSDPGVRAKLEVVANSDPYVGPPHPTEARGRYWIREQAARLLRPPDGDKAYFVMRSPDSRECRVQEESEPAIGDRYIGPFPKAENAKRSLCTHVDAITLNPSLCWRTVPADACAK